MCRIVQSSGSRAAWFDKAFAQRYQSWYALIVLDCLQSIYSGSKQSPSYAVKFIMEPATISVGNMEPQFTHVPTYMHASRRASCSKHEVYKAESALHGTQLQQRCWLDEN